MSKIKIPSPENAAVVASGRYPVTDKDAIDWSSKLFDQDGFPQQLVAIGGIQVVTKNSFAYSIWNRKDGKCVSHQSEGDYFIGNQPLSDIELTRRKQVGLEILRGLHEKAGQ